MAARRTPRQATSSLCSPAARPGGRERVAPRCPPCAGRPPSRRAPASPSSRAGDHTCAEIHGRRSRTASAVDCTSGEAARPRERSFPRRFVTSVRAIGVGHAAAAWQHASVLARRAPFCTWLAIPTRAARLPRGTGSIFGTNLGTAQRAGDGSRVYPANRHRHWIRTRSCGRRWPIQLQIGAAFGYETRTNTLRQTLLGPKSVPCTNPPLWGKHQLGATKSWLGATKASLGVTGVGDRY